MATPILPTPRRRSWHLAVCEAGLMAAAMMAVVAAHFGRDAILLLRDEAGPQMLLLCCACAGAMYMLDLYESPVLGDLREIGARLPQVLGLALLLLGASARWMAGPALLARTWIEALLTGGLGVCAFRGAYIFWHHHPRLSEPVLLVGEGELAAELRRELARHTEMGLPVVGTLGAPVESELEALARVPARRFARHLVASFVGGWEGLGRGLRARLEHAGYRLDDGAELYERLTGRLPLEALRQRCPGFRADGELSATWLAVKRGLDTAAAAAALLISWPLLLLLTLAIRFDSPGPALFRQRRLGRNGRPFTLYKFRSMRINPGPVSPARRDDPRCTRVGRWLRRLRLDELPQFWNILRGDMSVVGPRPFVPEQEEECLSAIPFYAQRWSVPPGATGWAQVNRGYCATIADNRDKLAYDLFYVRHFSATLDCLILLQTLKVLFLGRGGR